MPLYLLSLPLLGRLGRSGLIPHFKIPSFLLIGLIYGLILGCKDWVLIGFMVANWAFEASSPEFFSPGCLGRIVDGLGNRRDYMALADRGALSIVFLPLCHYYPLTAVIVSSVIWWPFSAYLGTKLPKCRFLETAWEWREALTPLFIGLSLCLSTLASGYLT